MITCDLIGRLGNQLFQAAATIAHARRMEVEYGIPDYTVDNRIWRQDLPKTLPRLKLGMHIPVWHEPQHSYVPIPEMKTARLNGYFQSYKYFEDYEEEIKELFGFKAYAGIDRVSLHVRRGDYVAFRDKHPPVTLEYISKAIAMFPDDEFLVFSDDLSWCHKHLKGDRFTFSEGKDHWIDLKTMALCKSNIISNSTFSWWAAYMNNNPHKEVVTPDESNWFGPGNKHLDVKDLIPEQWIRIKY